MTPIEINGTTYETLRAETPTAKFARGHSATATAMQESNISQELTVRRPLGRAMYAVMQYQNGSFSALVRIPA